MSKEKTKTLLLLDLTTFALTQDTRNGNRKDFDLACKLAEKQSLPQLQMYKDFISSIEED
ncbi:MAG: hypothetical protein PVH84_09260 [Candidatus Aminicenantes bacterium]|jgi:hypothetical protein